jgi:hypothetical protein
MKRKESWRVKEARSGYTKAAAIVAINSIYYEVKLLMAYYCRFIKLIATSFYSLLLLSLLFTR